MPKWLKLGSAICLHQKKPVFPRTLMASLASLCLWLEPFLSDSVNRRRGRCFSAITAVKKKYIYIFYICSSTLIPSPRDFSWWGTKISGDTGVRDQQTFVISCQAFLFSSDSISISNPNYKLVEDFFFAFALWCESWQWWSFYGETCGVTQSKLCLSAKKKRSVSMATTLSFHQQRTW